MLLSKINALFDNFCRELKHVKITKIQIEMIAMKFNYKGSKKLKVGEFKASKLQ